MAKCTKAGQGAKAVAGGSLHNRHCQSKRIWSAATASASYGQLCAGCMISAHAEPGTAQVAAQGALKLPPRVQGMHTLLQCKQQMHGQSQAETDRPKEMITAVITAGWHTQLLPPTPSLPCLYSSFLSNLSILCIFSLCPSLDVAFVQGSFGE